MNNAHSQRGFSTPTGFTRRLRKPALALQVKLYEGPNLLFADGSTVIACYGNAKPTDKHLGLDHPLYRR